LSSMSVTCAFAVPRPTLMVVSSEKAPLRLSPISMTLNEGEPLTVSTLPVQLTFFDSKSPKVDLQLCWVPLRVPDVHPTSERAAQPARKYRNADPPILGRVNFRPMFAIIHDSRRTGHYSLWREGDALKCMDCYAVLPRE
jgi:hypothetical protein